MRLDFPEAPAHERPRGGPAASVKITQRRVGRRVPWSTLEQNFALSRLGFFPEISVFLWAKKTTCSYGQGTFPDSAAAFPGALFGFLRGSGTLRQGIAFRCAPEKPVFPGIHVKKARVQFLLE